MVKLATSKHCNSSSGAQDVVFDEPKDNSKLIGVSPWFYGGGGGGTSVHIYNIGYNIIHKISYHEVSWKQFLQKFSLFVLHCLNNVLIITRKVEEGSTGPRV